MPGRARSRSAEAKPGSKADKASAKAARKAHKASAKAARKVRQASARASAKAAPLAKGGSGNAGSHSSGAGRAGAGGPAVDIVEKGSFDYAVCATCGWTGAGRRARKVAREDARQHACGQ